MPGMNGLQLAATVRQMRAGQPIIMATGFGDGRDDPDESHEHIDLVMHKPVPRRELRRALVSVMSEIVSFEPETFIHNAVKPTAA